MRLIVAHRILIRTFVALALVFAFVQYRRWQTADDTTALVIAIASVAVGVGCLVYLARARHLHSRG